MSRLVAIGNRAFVIALAGIGAEPLRCETGEEFSAELKRLAVRKDVKLALISETHAEISKEAVEAFRARSSAALLALPLMPSEAHPSLEIVRRMIEQATGASLI